MGKEGNVNSEKDIPVPNNFEKDKQERRKFWGWRKSSSDPFPPTVTFSDDDAGGSWFYRGGGGVSLISCCIKGWKETTITDIVSSP